MSERREEEAIHGVLGEFRGPDELVALVRRLRRVGFSRFDVYSPTPIEALDEAVVPRPRRYLVGIIFLGSALGAFLSYFMQYYAAVMNFPINVGGRPLNSWPAFVPTSWEICALFTVFSAFAAFLLFCRLPRLYHPIFAGAGFERASQDRFFICVEAEDPRFDPERLSRLFSQYGALRVSRVPL